MTAPGSPLSSPDVFLDLVRRTGAADERRLDAALPRLVTGRAARDPRALAAGLVSEGLLTEFQARHLLAGKADELVLGKYQVVDLLGSGTMSTVYLCRHPVMDRWVAVKLLANSKAANPQLLKRFHREARAAATLCHPNIVHAFDFVEDDKGLFLVMEYVDGATLRGIVANHAPLSPHRAAVYIRQAAAGLQHAHEAGMVHRDVKPGNVMVDRDGGVKVLDLGLTLIAEESTVLTQGVLGTVDYLAPEQTFDSHKVDARADVYGLGGTLYFCLTGRPPCGEGTVAQKVLAHRSRQPLPLRTFRNDVPPELEAVLLRMLAKEPAARFASMTAVSEALALWAREPVEPPPVREMPRWSPTVRSVVAATPATGQPLVTPHSATTETPVIPRSGLTPVPGRSKERKPSQATVRETPSQPGPSRPAPAALSAYSTPAHRPADGSPALRPLVFPKLPPAELPPSSTISSAPAVPLTPSESPPATAPTTESGRPADSRRTLHLTLGILLALGVGVAIGVVMSQFSL